MTVAFYLNCVSTHQMPLAREVSELVDNFVYVDAGMGGQAYQSAGVDGLPFEVIDSTQRRRDAEAWIEKADLVYTGLRDLGLFERRAANGLRTFYTSERWFKPPLGVFRMLVPGYRKMVKRFVKWANEDPGARVLAIGPHAKRDFLRMGVQEEKIVVWGYFVAPSTASRKAPPQEPPLNTAPPSLGLSVSSSTSQTSQTSRTSQTTRVLRVLWAGRDIPLKHVSDIERAVALANKNLKKKLNNPPLNTYHSSFITFTKLTGVTPNEVRRAMREHDTFVFASDGYEGWGAVVSEALEEGMNVVGTWECGAPPTLLPKERLYHCGDVKALAHLLKLEWEGRVGQRKLPPCSIGDWTAKKAAERLIKMI